MKPRDGSKKKTRKKSRVKGWGKPDSEDHLFVVEFAAGSGWEWFWGYGSRAEAEADARKYAQRKGDEPIAWRVTEWRRVS